MKKIISLLIMCMLTIGMVGCNNYKENCNQEYCIMGQTLYNCSRYENKRLDEKVKELILEVNDNKSLTMNITNKGDTFEGFDGEIYEITLDEFKYSKNNNDDGQFSDAQYGVLHSIGVDLKEEKNEFIETFGDNRSFIKSDSDFYNDVIEMYDEYHSVIVNIIEDYNGSLSEEDLMKIKHMNSTYYDLMVIELMKIAGNALLDAFTNGLYGN